MSHVCSISYDTIAGVCYRTLDFMGLLGYRVGDDGSVWTKKNGKWGYGEWRIKKATGDPTRAAGRSYLHMSFRTADGKPATFFVHKLVLLAFHGPGRQGMETRHLDGNPKNNCTENLRWGTRAENGKDRIRHRVTVRNYAPVLRAQPPETDDPKNGTNHIRKLTEDDVRQIKKSCASREESHRQIARRFRVSVHTIRAIATGNCWGHVV